MTIEESIRKEPGKFQEIIDAKEPDVKAALQELSAKLDGIFGAAIKAYCEQTGAEVDLDAIPTYKTMNRMITGKLDALIGAHIQEKRKDL